MNVYSSQVSKRKLLTRITFPRLNTTPAVTAPGLRRSTTLQWAGATLPRSHTTGDTVSEAMRYCFI